MTIPLWIKLAFTLMTLVIVVVYWVQYGPGNFLWFSDIALFAAAIALWLESSLLASMMALAVALPELFWIVSYFWRLLTGRRLSGLTDYMFDPAKPRYLRALSLFHVPLPFVLLWLVWELGYDPLALPAQTLLAWVVLPLCYWLTDPAENVNWVHGFGQPPVKRLPPLAHLGLAMLAFPIAVYVPSHFLFLAVFP
jgi:hypothetical protein